MTPRLDCLTIGYHELSFELHRQSVTSKGPDSAEYRIYARDQVTVHGEPLPYLDVLNRLVPGVDGEPRTSAPEFHLGEVPNLAAVYLTNHLRRHGLAADFVSATVPERDRLVRLLVEEAPTVTAITTTFYLMPAPVESLTRLVRAHNVDTVIVVGGPLVTNLVADLPPSVLATVLADMGADVYVLESQGERTLEQVVSTLKAGHSLDDVPNLLFIQEGALRVTPRVQEDNALDDCAIAWTRFGGERLGNVLQTRTARSCAFKCSFCDYPVRAGALSLASLDTVEAELRQMAEIGAEHVAFIDDTFNVPIQRFEELCRMLIRNNFGFRWYSYLRCSNIRSEGTFDLMQASGCAGVFLGIESGDDAVLRNMNKGATTDRYRRGIENLNERGIASFASFIVGFPGETRDTIENTIALIESAAPTFFRAEPWWYNHRSPIHLRKDEFGLSGRGYRWSHATMDVTGACDAIDEVFDRVTASHWMPMYDFDFWALPYLLGKGLSLAQVGEIHRLCQDLMRLGDRSSPARDAAEADLARFCGSLSARPTRFAELRRAGATVLSS